ncbi:hypothetical protein LzC2_13450 [Planctomycetes bacterium LzC2]|uniref:Uncharacterized protein n=1 Tax=Alienimonas chondri TaxID=2681879 RepID=A0ABX1VBG8_9PLAN|nr:hypothetical protein [Alienimonas chondri]
MIVQHIDVGWTKASRGGPGAVARNCVPEALLLPPDRPRYDGLHTTRLHQVRFGERNGFAAPLTESLEALGAEAAVRLGNAMISRSGSDVTLQIDWRAGVPRRGRGNLYHPGPDPEPELVVLPGQWARAVYNLRNTGMDCGRWWYERHTVNVANLDPAAAPANLFTRSEPAAEWRNLAWLR